MVEERFEGDEGEKKEGRGGSKFRMDNLDFEGEESGMSWDDSEEGRVVAEAVVAC